MKMLQQASRLSRVWIPGGGIAASGTEDGYSKLIRAGYLRPSHSGIFHLLPLGRRVQEKVERLIARHMEESLAASRVSLSSISAEALWEKSGRLQNVASELFRFSDRKDVPYLLSPTHEEEITSLVARTVNSYKDLPLRLYQITRKYRDEFRPRHGLLRSREFTMKDLYTFDSDRQSALETYAKVRSAYSAIFSDMKLPVLAARASSGDMGGDLSHEYHLPTPLGDDRVIHCDSCDYVINEEIAESATSKEIIAGEELGVWRGISKDRSTLVNVWYPRRTTLPGGKNEREYTDMDIKISAVKSLVSDLDTAVGDATPLWSTAVSGPIRTAKRLVSIADSRIPSSLLQQVRSGLLEDIVWPARLESPLPSFPVTVYDGSEAVDMDLNLLRIRTGDHCPECSSGVLKAERAIELGHTFHLGTRYSAPLGATIAVPQKKTNTPIEMGCYGIGISRLIGAVAEHMADDVGLNWPAIIAPYSCVIIPRKQSDEADATKVYRHIIGASTTSKERLDVVVDDRERTLPWKLNDADLIGFPVIIILGREWHISRRVEVQCRRLGMKGLIEMERLAYVVDQLYRDL
ncbi:hypothetical protein B0H67DRAFT_562093 [Lasiosphaeris hirsuta]|uniref:proline--tRNA ligase n=1 Tax=Lasiosphaeris hirsuta TaxID=260670 RepID=A0AA40BAA4_9PEZI|nr:hypothetical protein B0H67DRAFT_562093 [Lasiosphaeris hirsuta]